MTEKQQRTLTVISVIILIPIVGLVLITLLGPIVLNLLAQFN